MHTEQRPEEHGGVTYYAGTFLICAALLAFEISTVRTINFAIGPSYIFVAIAIAMLGLTAAGSVLSLFDLSRYEHSRNLILGALCLVIALFIVLTHASVVGAKEQLNDLIQLGGERAGLDGVVQANLVYGPLYALRIGLVLTAPYFFFGGLLAFLFATSKAGEYSRLYAADLIGAAAGCVLIVGAMQWASYTSSVTLPAAVACLAGAFFSGRAARGKLALGSLILTFVLAFLPLSEGYRKLIEPDAEPSYLVRDYRNETSYLERWKGWNSFTRVAAIEQEGEAGKGAVLSLANGDGMAFLLPSGNGATRVHPPVIPALLAGVPETALVVFAGAGADMMSLKDHGTREVVGVELNETLVEAGLALEDYALADFLADENVALHIGEARDYLERDQSQYDLAMVSWSGATAVYYIGALGGTTQFVFTYEGLTALLERVHVDGTAVILQVNKFDMLHGLRRYMQERGLENPDRAAIILYQDGAHNRWDASWDDNPLLIRLSGWTETDVAQIEARAAQAGYKIAYAPGRQVPAQYARYAEVLNAGDVDAAVREASEAAQKRFGISTDDRPFVLDKFYPARYLTSGYWSMNFAGQDAYEDVFHFMRVGFIALVSLLAFILAIAPLFLRSRKVTSRRRAAVYLGYFLLLGAGFMFVEIGLIHKVSILYGNPGVSIAVVLGLVILSTGLGSLLSEYAANRGLTLAQLALLVAFYSVIAGYSAPALVQAVMGAAIAYKLFATALLIVPGGLLMGQLFPQGLARASGEDTRLVPWAWAINGAMSATVAGVAPLVAQISGFQSLFMIGAVLYALVALLPIGAKRAARA